MDCELLNKASETVAETLRELRKYAIWSNRNWADRLAIPRSMAITCVKPSGTVSQLVDCASGIHPRHARAYIRRVRQSEDDPLTRFLIDRGFPHEKDVLADRTVVFSFPIRAPEAAVLRSDLSALEHLELWKFYQEHWCEHKPSITVSVREDEWLPVGAWAWENFDSLSGVAFLPHSNHTYAQPPYEEVDEGRLGELQAAMPPSVDWDELSLYEQEDNTTGTSELACSAGACEV